MNRPRAADDFAMIRARMEELRREREAAHATESQTKPDPPTHPTKYRYGLHREISPAAGLIRQSGSLRG